MKHSKFLLVFALMFLISCSKDQKLDDYIELIERADKVIFYIKKAETFTVTKSVDSFMYLQNLKKILKRNIEPEKQRKFIAEYKIEIYTKERVAGVLLISDTKGDAFVNFASDKFGFGFKLTYGIGMSL